MTYITERLVKYLFICAIQSRFNNTVSPTDRCYGSGRGSGWLLWLDEPDYEGET